MKRLSSFQKKLWRLSWRFRTLLIKIEFLDRVFMMLLYDSGVWIQNVLGIKLQDLRITGDNRYVVLTG